MQTAFVKCCSFEALEKYLDVDDKVEEVMKRKPV
jgi:hypothetical protein